MAIPAGEIARPQEIHKPQEVGEKSQQISRRFRRTKTRANSLSTGIKRAFTKTTKDAPNIVFDAEQNELTQLSDDLAKLDQDTAQRLGLPDQDSDAQVIPQEEIPQPSQPVDIEDFYNNELTRFKAEQSVPGKKAWEAIEKAAAERQSRQPQEESKETKPQSVKDKIRRQTLLMQARLAGVKDLGKFQELADYFESTLSDEEDKYVNVPKGLSDEQKKKVIEDWKARGWHASTYNFYEYEDKRKASLHLTRRVPLRLGKSEVKLMKGLISKGNDPVELAKSFSKIGFPFAIYIDNPDHMKKLGEFFTAPHAKEALELAQGISKWRYNWFTTEGGYGIKPVELGQIEFLTKVAQSPDPKTAFPPELVGKIDALSRALNIGVDAAGIGELQTIMNNPDYLDFVAYLTQLEGSNHRIYTDRIPVFDNIVALDKAGVLKPVLDLYRSGVSIEPTDRYSSSTPSLRKLFDSYDAESKPKEVQQEVVGYLKEALSQPEVQKFLGDPQDREFAGLLGNLRGQPIALGELSDLGWRRSWDKEAIYAIKFIQNVQGAPPSIEKLGKLASNPRSIEAFRDPNFPVFLQTLQEKTGYKFNSSDLISYEGSSILADIFSNPETREGLVRESTAQVIKALHPDGQIVLHKAEFYIFLGNNPNMVPTINALRGMGYEMSSHRLPDPETLEAIANNPDTLKKFTSEEMKDLNAQLTKEFNWHISEREINSLIALYDDRELQQELFNPENADFVRTIRPRGLSTLYDLKPMLALDTARRDILTQMVSRLGYPPDFYSRSQQEILDKLAQNEELRTKFFSDKTQEILNKLKQDFGYHMFGLQVKDIEALANAPSYLPDFIGELQSEFKYKFEQRDLVQLVQLSINRESFGNLLGTLGNYGYEFKSEDFGNVLQLATHAEKLPKALSTINELSGGSYVFKTRDIAYLLQLEPFIDQLPATITKLGSMGYKFNIYDAPYLLQIEPYIDRIPATVATLSEVMGYKFNIRDGVELAFVVENDFTKERLVALKQIHDKYKDNYSGEFSIGAIRTALFIENNEDTIARLEGYNYKFRLQDVQHLRDLLIFPEKETLFQVLDTIRDNLSFSYSPSLSQEYVRMAQIPGIEEKLKEAGSTEARESLMQDYDNLRLFIALGADVPLYNHARKLLSDDYFRNIRDAQNRLQKFNDSMLSGKIPPDVLAKIFSVSEKATELDRIALKYGINSEIANAGQNENWQGPFLQAANFQEANMALTKITAGLATPVIYSGLQGEELGAKKRELTELAGKDKEFDNIIEIAFRSVGIYGQRYPNKGRDFDALMGAIRQSLELNLERNPKAYLEKRAELSKHQFDRMFEGMPQDTRDRVMKMWLDLSPRRRLRVSGNIVTTEEATLSRLNRIRNTVQADLSVHLQTLFASKIKELEAVAEKGEVNGPGVEQLAIYRQYLMTPQGTIRQDIPMMYRGVQTFIRRAQRALKNPQTPKEEKGKLGKNLGTYQAVSDSLKALYRLATISEERYKAKRNYLNEIDKHVGEFSGALKKLRLLDPDRRSADVNTRALEGEVLLDLFNLKTTMAEENVSGQTVFDTESTVSFLNLAKAPEITQSCQRLTEETGYNHAAYSRLLDGSNEMIDVYDVKNGERNRLARSFIELSRVKLTGEAQPRLAVLIDREYVNPQYQNFDRSFSKEMVAHMLDRISTAPEVSLLFDSYRVASATELEELLASRGYQIRQVSGEYFINQSNIRLQKYYDSMGGLVDVSQPSTHQFGNFFLIEKVKQS